MPVPSALSARPPSHHLRPPGHPEHQGGDAGQGGDALDDGAALRDGDLALPAAKASLQATLASSGRSASALLGALSGGGAGGTTLQPVSATVNGDQLVVTFNAAPDPVHQPNIASFAVFCNGLNRALTDLRIDGEVAHAETADNPRSYTPPPCTP